MTLLRPGDEFPAQVLSLPGGGTLTVPDDLHGGYVPDDVLGMVRYVRERHLG